MPDNLKRDVLIVGAGNMAAEYLKVLQYLNHHYVVVGRGSENAASFEKKTGVKPVTGGIAAFLQETKNIPQYAIVATGVDVLKENCESLVKAGVKYILLEKPGAASYDEFRRLADFARQSDSKIFLAYNRRFYSSVR
ncbi:MAG: Gfo/Idh/MocA family oxidoreductase, partial [Bacteroidetes bacterium]|nr:Gfo/Idh/MocA family oxidoreductase [Bacteroidota bacterium]